MPLHYLSFKKKKKIGTSIHFIKFKSPGAALYLYKSTIPPYFEHCCYGWAGTPSYYLELLDKLQERKLRIVDPSLAASLKPLAHCHNVTSLTCPSRYYFSKYSS